MLDTLPSEAYFAAVDAGQAGCAEEVADADAIGLVDRSLDELAHTEGERADAGADPSSDRTYCAARQLADFLALVACCGLPDVASNAATDQIPGQGSPACGPSNGASGHAGDAHHSTTAGCDVCCTVQSCARRCSHGVVYSIAHGTVDPLRHGADAQLLQEAGRKVAAI